MSDPYRTKLRPLVAGLGALAALSPDEAETELNAATVATSGSTLLTPDAFAARFTPEEFVSCEDSSDPVVRQLMFRLRVRRDPLDLGSDTVQAGLAYMSGQHVPGLGTIAVPTLSPERAAAIGAVPPGPNITPREQIGWPEAYIYASDVIAARAMED